jgi:hypothetical protein
MFPAAENERRRRFEEATRREIDAAVRIVLATDAPNTVRFVPPHEATEADEEIPPTLRAGIDPSSPTPRE